MLHIYREKREVGQSEVGLSEALKVGAKRAREYTCWHHCTFNDWHPMPFACLLDTLFTSDSSHAECRLAAILQAIFWHYIFTFYDRVISFCSSPGVQNAVAHSEVNIAAQSYRTDLDQVPMQ